jgi:hypothetical protein
MFVELRRRCQCRARFMLRAFLFAGLAGAILPKGSRSILPNGRHICVLSCAESFRSASPVSVVSCADAPSCRVASFFSGFADRFIFSQIISTKPVCFLPGSFFPYLFLYINSRCIFLNLFDVLQHLLFSRQQCSAEQVDQTFLADT